MLTQIGKAPRPFLKWSKSTNKDAEVTCVALRQAIGVYKEHTDSLDQRIIAGYPRFNN